MKSLKISNLIGRFTYRAVPILLAVISAFLSAVPVNAVTLEDPVLASSAILGEVETKQILHDQNSGEIRNADSLVKIMTLLLAAEATERSGGKTTKETVVTISGTAVANLPARSEKTGLTAGETMTFLDLLMCAYIGGGADASNAIAERVSGTVEAFVEDMNIRAAELGCKNTIFTDPHGQGSQLQQTTAYDLFLIAAEASNHELFLEVAGAERHSVPATNYAGGRNLVSTNYIMSSSRQRYYSKYVRAGRVSATYENGYGSVEIAERGGMKIVSVILGASAVILEDNSTQMQNLSEAKRLLDWGFEKYSYRTLLPEIVPVTRIPVKYGNGTDYVNLRPDREITLLLPVDVKDEDIERDITIFYEEENEILVAPIRAGDEFGEILLSHEGRELARVKLIADTSVEMLRIAYLREQIAETLRGKWMLLILITFGILFILYIILVIRYRMLLKRRKQEIARRRRELAEQRRMGGDGYE